MALYEFEGAEIFSVEGMTVHVTNVVDPVAAQSHALDPATRAGTIGVYRSFGKRFMDVSLILIAAPIVVPVIAFFAFLVSLDGHSPFFKQVRVGKDGRRFTMWKLRTMVPDAEALLDRHLEENEAAREEWSNLQKLTRDPRCTRIGRAFRRTSLDELPQLVNVLMGDMSLIGPRPMLPEQQSLYPGRSYYKLRPGMTGFWQVSKRNESEFAARAAYDDAYHYQLSLWTDIKILFRTALVVMRGTGV